MQVLGIFRIYINVIWFADYLILSHNALAAVKKVSGEIILKVLKTPPSR